VVGEGACNCLRRSKARPIVETFFEWYDAQVSTGLDGTAICTVR
jgi:hypothetical protein